MGHRDLMSLYPVYQECKKISDELNFGFSFKWDQGDYETRIDINEDGNCVLGNGQLPLIGYEMFCPDILDYTNRIIIEFEEECQPDKGAKKRKGHFEINTRDVRRGKYYNKAKFDLLRIWESDKQWKKTLKQFLVDTYHNRLVHRK